MDTPNIIRRAIRGIACLMLAAPVSAQNAVTLHVANDGPLRTLAAARDAIRRLNPRGPVTVLIHGGLYSLDEPLVFTTADSGTPEAPIVYTASAKEKPVLSGGRRIGGWKRGKDGVWTARVSWYFHDLYVNGQRRQRARSPNTGFFNVDGQIGFEANSQFRFRPGDIRPEWAGKDVEVVSLLQWQSLRMPIVRADDATHTVTLAGQRPQNGADRDPRYWIENTLDALDAPGEWYLDRQTGTLYYRPMPGEDPNRAEVIAPHLDELVRFEGAHHITFRGLTLRDADWTIGPNGYADMQAASEVPAAVTATGARFIAIENCTFTRLGQFAVAFGKGSKDNRIAGNQMYDLGAGGVKIGDPRSDAHPNGERPNYPRSAEETSSRNVISDNHIHHIGNAFPSAVGVWVGQSDGNLISHNEIDNTYFTGISVGWTWGWGRTAARDNLIEFNHVHDIGRGLMSDMGCIYTLGDQQGALVRNNLCHDVTRYGRQPGGYGGWGIYLDSASSGVTVENNVVYRAWDGGLHNQYGQLNTIRNNIFALGHHAEILRTRLAKEISFTFEHNIVYWREGALLLGAAAGAGRWDEGKVKFDSNLYFHPGAGEVRYGKMTFAEWQQQGQDIHSLQADPKFRDPDHGDFALPPDSPAFQIGFKPIDLSQVGPRSRHDAAIDGVAGVRLRVADLAKARAFYTGVLGWNESDEGVFRVNADQFVVFSTGSGSEPLIAVIFSTKVKRDPIVDPDGHRIEFSNAPKGLPNDGQVSSHLLHVGLGTSDPRAASEFYREHFGFRDVWRGPTPTEFRIDIMRAPGLADDYVELLQPQPPVASSTHLGLEVADIQQTYKALSEKGASLRGKPRIASNGHWVINMSDPNGIRVEFMEPNAAK